MNRISKLFCTYDRAAESFSPPFAAPHVGVASRGFIDAVHNPRKDSDISNHPDDFDLFEIGEFDSQTGLVTGYSVLDKPVLSGKQVAIQPPLPLVTR